MLCGGGEEGDADDATAWSAAYAQGLAAGDVSGDGRVRVAVLSTGEETEWIPEYLVFLGADEAFNLRVGTRDAADDAALADTFASVDAVFLKGGDQGEYYDRWNDTALETAIREVVARGGGVIGTSAGAMSQSSFALAGGADYVTADVLADSQTEYLDDVSDGGSGVHTDFFDFVPGVLVDTHFVTRARLGRLVGAMARVVDDGAGSPVGIGLDEQTCITVHEGAAQVSGLGSATFVRPSVETPVRVAGQPLIWAELQVDRLVEGWGWSLDYSAVIPAADAETVERSGTTALAEGDWEVNGGRVGDEARFGVTVDRSPLPYATAEGTEPPLLTDGIGVLNAHDSDRRGANDEALFRALYDHVGAVGYLVGDGGMLRREGDTLVATRFGLTPLATMVIDSSDVSMRALSPYPSPADLGDGSLHAAALTGLRLHVVYTDGDGRVWDPVGRTVE